LWLGLRIVVRDKVREGLEKGGEKEVREVNFG
jgi:hypothetical protein